MMSVEVWGMMFAGGVALLSGLVFARPRFVAAAGLGKVLALATVFEAAPLAVFSAEHFTAARDMMAIVPRWLPYPLFWTYFVGACLLAAAISFIAGRYVRWSASLLALLFLIIVATIDLPSLPRGLHNRFFWILTFREISFAGGAMVLAGSLWPHRSRTGDVLIDLGRFIVGGVMVFYGIQHFLNPRFVTGVPLEKPTPAWMPFPAAIAFAVGIALLAAGLCVLTRKYTRTAAGICGSLLLLLTVLFYGSIFVADLRASGNNSPVLVEGLNYIFDTMLFAATVLLAGRGRQAERPGKRPQPVAHPVSALTSR
jgi:uncharacterized membrane protein